MRIEVDTGVLLKKRTILPYINPKNVIHWFLTLNEKNEFWFDSCLVAELKGKWYQVNNNTFEVIKY